MGYTGLKPADTQTISAGPADIRDELVGLATGQVVNAGTLKGYSPGNASGNIPISNGTVCTGLNAEKVGGNLPSAFATSSHTHAVASGSSNGLMSNTDKTKLDGIAAGAEVNQNAFANVVAGGVTVQADAESDTLTLSAGTGITLTGNATSDTVTIAVTQDGHSHAVATTSSSGFSSAADKTKLDGIATGAEVNQNSFSTIVAGGTSIVADSKTDTFTINAGSGITVAGDSTNDACTISVTANGHTHNDATTGAAGFMTAAMVTKLNGIAAGAQTNQNAFSNVLVNGTTIAADSATDTIEFIDGANITLTPDATNDRVTIAVSGTVPSATSATTAGTCTGNSATATSASNLTGGNITGAMVVPTANRDIGIFGTYDSTKTQHIWSMGTAYKNAADGSSFGNLYGLAYKYNGSAGGHGVYLVNNGTAYCGLGTNLWTSGSVYEGGVSLNAKYLGISDNAVSATTATTATTATNATKLGGYSPASTNTVNTVALRDAAGDLVARLHRTEYPTTTGWNGAYVLGQNAVGSGVDNYARPIPLATLRTELDIPASALASVSVLTGVIAHGGTIPLPSGYTEAQCKWMVSPSNGVNGSFGGIFSGINCSANGTRVVTCQYWIEDYAYGSKTANYMIIGVK